MLDFLPPPNVHREGSLIQSKNKESLCVHGLKGAPGLSLPFEVLRQLSAWRRVCGDELREHEP